MLILPAIDLIEGVCVRLTQGRFDDVTRYGDPIEQAKAFADVGAAWAHVVDLDGARAGAPRQRELIGRIAKASGLKIQCGGGVRSRADVEALLEAGVTRVVVGSAALRRPDEVRQWLADFGAEQLCLAFDVRGENGRYEVTADAWRSNEGVPLPDALTPYEGGALTHTLVTDISRDGALTGPNVELIADLVRDAPALQVQASGGVSSLADLRALAEAGAAAAITGRALYERRFTLEDALAL